MEFRKTFRHGIPEPTRHQTLTPAQVLPEDDLVFFLIELVPQLDLTRFYAYDERETRDAPPFDVAMMASLLTYSYCVGVFSSRRIDTQERIDPPVPHSESGPRSGSRRLCDRDWDPADYDLDRVQALHAATTTSRIPASLPSLGI